MRMRSWTSSLYRDLSRAALLPVLLLTSLPIDAARVSDIASTRHNLSVSGSGSVTAVSESQICVFCHTPHQAEAIPNAPLWNRQASVAAYTPYTSDTIDANDIVSGIIIHLKKPMEIGKAAKDLGVTELRPVPIPDENGEILGQAYPERGLLFSLTENLKSLRISTILIEPVSAEMFRLRALYDFNHQYKLSLADLELAVQHDPRDAEPPYPRDGPSHEGFEP